MTELRPCPFCGGDADVTMLMIGAVIRVHVVCQKCGATGKMRRTAEDAILNWNLRLEPFTGEFTVGGGQVIVEADSRADAEKIVKDNFNFNLGELENNDTLTESEKLYVNASLIN